MTSVSEKNVLERIVKVSDLAHIAKNIGSGWQMLAPFLRVSRVTVEHIELDNSQTVMKIYHLLLAWRQEQAEGATLGALFHSLFEAGTGVSLDIQGMAAALNIQEAEIRKCKTLEREKQTTIKDDRFFQRLIDRCHTRLVEKMDPVYCLDYARQLEYIVGIDARDIEEQKLTSDKTRKILAYTKTRGKEGYEKLKKCLKQSNQGHLAEYLAKEEANLEREGRYEQKPTNVLTSTRVTAVQPELKDFEETVRSTFYDGRLLQLSQREQDTVKENCLKRNYIACGGFGTVYRQSISRLEMDVAVKKVTANLASHRKSVQKEMLASRILHPFIVPMVAKFEADAETFYLIYPYCQRGDLYHILEVCRRSCKGGKHEECKVFHMTRRTRICYQVASAIEYLHTSVPKVRDVVLHKDICTKNILIDGHYNSRLTDFGLAREEDDMSTTASARQHYNHPDVGHNKPASVLWDCFAYGVVIRELLTGLDPSGEGHFLKNREHSNVLDYSKNQKCVWRDDDAKVVAEALCRISTKCLTVNNEYGFTSEVKEELCINEGETFNFRDEVYKLKETFLTVGTDLMAREEISKSEEEPHYTEKCDVCMFNQEASFVFSNHTRQTPCAQTQKMRVCLACKKNSYLNPLTCFTCGSRLEREIGDGWGALLVAGRDQDKTAEKVFQNDVDDMKRVMVSKAPLIMGISEENVVEVFTDKTDIVPKIKTAIKGFKDKPVTTLLIYFSCHGKEDKNPSEYQRFQLGTEVLTVPEFVDELKLLDKVETFIIILDMCHAPLIRLDHKRVLQMNSCAEHEESSAKEKGSKFTKYLIQGLKGKSEKFKCWLTKSEDCKICDDFRSRRDEVFLSVARLFEYIQTHMEHEKPRAADKKYKQTPQINVQGDTVYIAYNCDKPVFIEFQLDSRKERRTEEIGLQYFLKFQQLQKRLYEAFGRKENEEKLTIKAMTFRKDDPYVECNTLEKVMAAWIRRSQLFVEFTKNFVQETEEH